MLSVVKTIARGLLPVLFLTTGMGVVAQQPAGNPVNPAVAPGDQDPNLPYPRGISKGIAQGAAGVSWSYGSFLGGLFVSGRFATSHASAPYVTLSPEKSFGRAPQDCEYLGFVDGVGSLLFNTRDGAVYSYTGGTESVVKRYASLKVTRSGNPAVTLSAPGVATSTGMTGSWLADDPNNKDGIILFMVKDEHTVVGTVMSGMVAAAMKRMSAGGAH